MQDPKRTIEKITQQIRNPQNAAFLEQLEHGDKLDNIKNRLDKPLEVSVQNHPEPLKEIEVKLAGIDVVTIKGDKGEKGDPGIDGKTPQQGVDYLTEQELQDILDKATPKKDVHYRDGIDGKDAEPLDEEKIIKAVLNKIPKPKDGKDGVSPEPIKHEVIIKETIKHLETLKGNKRPSLRMFRESDELIGTVELHKNMMSNMPKSLIDGDQRWHGGLDITINDTAPSSPYLNQLWIDTSP